MLRHDKEDVFWRDQAVYTLSVLSKDIVHASIATSVFLYLVQIHSSKISLISFFSFCIILISILISPIMGYLLDNTRCRFSKYKFWIGTGSFIHLILLSSFYFVTNNDIEHIAFYLGALLILWHISFCLIDVPLWSMLSLFSSNASTRSTTASIPCLGRHISTFLILFIFTPIVYNKNLIPPLSNDFFSFIFLSAFLFHLFSQGLFLLGFKTKPIIYTNKHLRNISKDEAQEHHDVSNNSQEISTLTKTDDSTSNKQKSQTTNNNQSIDDTLQERSASNQQKTNLTSLSATNQNDSQESNTKTIFHSTKEISKNKLTKDLGYEEELEVSSPKNEESFTNICTNNNQKDTSNALFSLKEKESLELFNSNNLDHCQEPLAQQGHINQVSSAKFNSQNSQTVEEDKASQYPQHNKTDQESQSNKVQQLNNNVVSRNSAVAIGKSSTPCFIPNASLSFANFKETTSLYNLPKHHQIYSRLNQTQLEQQHTEHRPSPYELFKDVYASNDQVTTNDDNKQTIISYQNATKKPQVAYALEQEQALKRSLNLHHTFSHTPYSQQFLNNTHLHNVVACAISDNSAQIEENEQRNQFDKQKSSSVFTTTATTTTLVTESNKENSNLRHTLTSSSISTNESKQYCVTKSLFIALAYKTFNVFSFISRKIREAWDKSVYKSQVLALTTKEQNLSTLINNDAKQSSNTYRCAYFSSVEYEHYALQNIKDTEDSPLAKASTNEATNEATNIFVNTLNNNEQSSSIYTQRFAHSNNETLENQSNVNTQNQSFIAPNNLNNANNYYGVKLKNILHLMFKNDQLLVIFLSSLSLNTIFGIILGATIVFILNYQLLTESSFIFAIVLGFITQILAMINFKNITRFLSQSTVYILSLSLLVLGYFTSAFFNISQNFSLTELVIPFTIFFMICNIGMGLSRVALTSMTTDIVDYGEFKLSLRTDGFIFGLRLMANHIGDAISFFFYSGAVVLSYLVDHDTAINFLFQQKLLIMIVLALGIFNIAIYFGFYRLNGTFYRNILNNLQFLRQNQSAHTLANDEIPNRFMLRYSLDISTMIIKLKANNIDDIVKAMVQKLSEVNAITSEHDYLIDLQARLDLSPCGIAEGIALPHAKSSAVRRATVVVATLDQAIDLGALDEQKCDLIFLLASPDDGYTHLNLLGRLSLLLNEPGFADKLRSCGSPTELFERLIQCEKHIVA